MYVPTEIYEGLASVTVTLPSMFSSITLRPFRIVGDWAEDGQKARPIKKMIQKAKRSYIRVNIIWLINANERWLLLK